MLDLIRSTLRNSGEQPILPLLWQGCPRACSGLHVSQPSGRVKRYADDWAVMCAVPCSEGQPILDLKLVITVIKTHDRFTGSMCWCR